MQAYHTYLFDEDGNMAYTEWPTLEKAQEKIKVLAEHSSTLKRMFILSDILLTKQEELLIATLFVSTQER